MKRLIVSDTHLGLYSDADAWLNIVLNFYKHIVKYCIKNNITQLIHLGDFFNNRKSLNTKTQHTAHRIAKILQHAKNLHSYIIVGNHDCYYKNQIQPNTLELFKEYNNISIIDEITKLDDILLVPWGEIPSSTQNSKYCFGHFAINGFHMNDSYKCKDGLDKVTFKDFDKVLSGHFHTPSSKYNITYLGAPYGQTFHDAGGVRGYHIFEDGKLTFIEYKDAPKFVKIYTNSEPLNENEIKDNIVKIIFTKDFGTNANQEIVDNILKCKPFLYSVNFTNLKSEEEVTEDECVEMDSKEKIVDQYIETQTFSTNTDIKLLKNIFKKLMKEAGDSKSNIKIAEGTKIECIDIGFQNFLSFGSKWQEIPLHNGVNFVTGIDKDKGKSNGAGKSSFLETIPFALFGKTARDIKQNQIVNWKNKKNCQVVFRFKINDDIYEINRKLKPNSLEIYKNGDLLDQDAHKTDYQSMFENIFGMDVKMFMSLIHSNVNSSANIMNMKKPEKRAFLERMFGLIIYSDMNKLCNEKLREIENKKYKIDTDINSGNDNIESSKVLKNKFHTEIKSKKESIEGVDEIQEKIDKLKEDNPDLDIKIVNTNNEIRQREKDFSIVQIKHEKYLASEDTRCKQIEKEIKAIDDLEEQRKINKKIQKSIDNIIEKTGDIDNIINDIDIAGKKLESYKKSLNDVNLSKLKLYKELANLKADLKKNEEGLALLAEGKCPTCGQDVKDPIKHHKKDITSIKKRIIVVQKEYDDYDKNSTKYQKETETYENKIKVLHKTKDTLNDLRSKIKDVDSEKNKDELIESKSLIAQNRMDAVEIFKKNQIEHNNKIKALDNRLTDLNREHSIIKAKEKELDIKKSQVEEVKRHVKSLKEMIKEQNEKIFKIKENVKELKDNKIKLNNIVDYLNSIKYILKDENIKQFTIKQIMPFLNKQTNYYLSEVNYGFYVNIDKWLDVEIKGPGIRNATYDSLSGGERRGIDIALQLSLLDIAQVQSGLFPDILILDELLDSSIDGIGMDQIMKIIKTKQNESNKKVFIISHRQEIDAELIDNQYKVIKEDGYSRVII